jgi:membrane protease YdiL (CAAX protease family)
VISPVWSAGRGPLAVLPDRLFRTDGNPVLYVLLAWVLSLAGSLALGALLAAVLPEAETPDLTGAPPWAVFLGIVVLSPVFETLIMVGVLSLLLRWTKPWVAVLVSAALWGVAHSLMTPSWGAVIWWPFTIFSLAYVTWRPHGAWRAIGIAAAIHILQNALPAIAIVWPTA